MKSQFIIQQLAALQIAFNNLAKTWDEYPYICDKALTPLYPFNESFDELNANIDPWIQDAKRILQIPAKTCTANSSHGTITFDTETGYVLNSDIDETDDGAPKNIGTFDTMEYKRHYNVTELPEQIDILDIGYWLEDETYEEPAHDWRIERDNMRKGLQPDGTPYPAPVQTVPTVQPAQRTSHEAGMIAALITHNMFDQILEAVRQKGHGVIDTCSLISDWAIIFEEKHRHTDWEDLSGDPMKYGFTENVNCWDEAILEFSGNLLHEYKNPPMPTILSFREWRRTRTVMPKEQFCKNTGTDPETIHADYVFSYDGDLYIEIQTEEFYLIIGHQDFFDNNLKKLEKKLYELYS